MVGSVGQWVWSGEICVEIGRVVRQCRSACSRSGSRCASRLVEIGQRDAAVPAKRHLPVAVEGAPRLTQTASELTGRSVPSRWRRNRRSGIRPKGWSVVPVEAQDEESASGRRGIVAQMCSAPGRRCRPARRVAPGATSIDGDTFQPGPASAPATRRCPQTSCRPLAPLAGEILRADRGASWRRTSRDRLPRCRPSPLKRVIAVSLSGLTEESRVA